LAKAANAERQAYEALVKQGPADNPAKSKGEDWQDAVIAFEDNYYSLSEGKAEVLRLGFDLTQKHQLDNAWSEKIILLLVKSEPEKYASLLGLQLAQLNVPTDETWLTKTTRQDGWTSLNFSLADWHPAQNLGAGTNFQGYDVQRLWLTGDSTNGTRLAPADEADSAAVDSIAPGGTPPPPRPLGYFRKNFVIAGLPVSGQIQLLADDSFNLFVNGEYIAEFNLPPNGKPAAQIKDLSNYLRSGENAIALEVRDTDGSGGVLEAVVFIKSLPGWEQREAELRAKKERREELMIFERGILPNIY
jgi:hypothetical protein